MPITNLRLINFKCFADSGDIPLAPLTLIFGRNNTGKSSILQSLLLLRQTLDSPEFGPRLNLRGPLHLAGTYADVVHQHRSKEHIQIWFTFSWPKTRFEQADLQLEFCSDEPQSPRLTRLEVKGRGFETLQIQRGRGKGGPYELWIGNANLHGEKESNFRFAVNRLFPLIGREPPRVGRPSEKREQSRSSATFMLTQLEDRLRNLRGVGAFRRQPSRRYEYQGRVPDVVDAIGENVVNAIIEVSTRRGRKKELLASVNRWLKRVGRVRLMLPLRRISRAARIYEVRMRDTDSGRWANFADVGFSIGQAFPVLVEGLRTPPGGMFLVQEPEIHLHPDAQLAMADFLIDLAKTGRHVIVETHSEHLLLRVRHRIAEAKSNGRRRASLDPSMVSIIYVDKRRDGASRANKLELDEVGQVEKWPADFMEEATEERMAIMENIAGRQES
jgi:predicted ATPase